MGVPAQGFAAPGFERVAEAFERNFSEHGEIGAAFAAYVDGELVVDLWGGWADRRRNAPWRRDSLAGVLSGTKGLVATCLLLLLDRAAEIPATNGIVTARSMARLYGCLACGGAIDGVRLLSPETIDRGRRCLARGQDPDLGAIAFATGFQVQTMKMGLGPAADAYGHGGAGGSSHGAWPSLRTGFSYVPSLLASATTVDPRAQGLLAALHTAIVR